MKYDLTAIQNLPDTFSLQDLCRVCHISKRDGRYYLQSELIPCTYTGKKTRCYQTRGGIKIGGNKNMERKKPPKSTD